MVKWRHFFASLVACIVLAGGLNGAVGQNAAQGEPIATGTSAGFQLSRYQNDFALGLQLTSPFFAQDRVAVRLRGNAAFHQHVDDGTSTWTPYGNASLGVVGVAGTVGNSIRLYGEGGVIGLVPSNDFSSESFVPGGYGVFGFDFFASKTNRFFLEIGGVGTGARADSLPTDPVYSNGFLINVGFRGSL